MDEVLTAPVIIAAGMSAIALLLSVVVIHRLTVRREDRADQRKVQREAASALTKALQNIRGVVERSATHPVRPQHIADAVTAWETAYRKYATRIPQQGQHVRHSVAAALGEHFGVVGASNMFPEAADFDIAEHDPIWWDNADSYLAYLVDRFSRWRDNPHAVRKMPILDFDTWLARRAQLFT
ncbi:hypothetical protein GCM10011374_40110 [Kocuria dechangensis]|uniref:Uncharacterized protein n=1 Tax=Kocuria dechangensis TaxID=1176249 RepID=A0A917H9H9_9MICC|nr:hypothetical protein [Kocuria dechangensis]GGG71401.1 hypothetical protein GCM10011374_40110 [Kocuria dechangensis]